MQKGIWEETYQDGNRCHRVGVLSLFFTVWLVCRISMGCFLERRPKLMINRKKKFIEGTKDNWPEKRSLMEDTVYVFKLSFHFKLKCLQAAELTSGRERPARQSEDRWMEVSASSEQRWLKSHREQLILETFTQGWERLQETRNRQATHGSSSRLGHKTTLVLIFHFPILPWNPPEEMKKQVIPSLQRAEVCVLARYFCPTVSINPMRRHVSSLILKDPVGLEKMEAMAQNQRHLSTHIPPSARQQPWSTVPMLVTAETRWRKEEAGPLAPGTRDPISVLCSR